MQTCGARRIWGTPAAHHHESTTAAGYDGQSNYPLLFLQQAIKGGRSCCSNPNAAAHASTTLTSTWPELTEQNQQRGWLETPPSTYDRPRTHDTTCSTAKSAET